MPQNINYEFPNIMSVPFLCFTKGGAGAPCIHPIGYGPTLLIAQNLVNLWKKK